MAFELMNSLDDNFGSPRCCMFKDSNRLSSVLRDSKAEAGDFPFSACLWYLAAVCHHAFHSAFGDALLFFALL